MYVVAALLEGAGVAIAVWGWIAGRRHAAAVKRGQPYWGPVFSGAPSAEKLVPNRLRAQAKRQERRRDHELAQVQDEVTGLLRGAWRELLGAGLLVAGIVVGTIANFAAS